MAYNATTGGQLWAQSHLGFNTQESSGASAIVSPDGSELVVVGDAVKPSASYRVVYQTVAYSTTNGAQLWSATLDGFAAAVTVSPDGSEVFVTGYGATKYYSRGLSGATSYGTVALSP